MNFFLRQKNKYLVFIMLIAFLLRGWGIWFGLPDFHFHADENFIISNLLKMIETRSFTPQNVVYPTFIYYILGLFFFFFTLFNQSIDLNFLLLTGRLISLFTGTLSIFLVYLIAQEIFNNKKIALISAFLLAINFLHVVNSQYLKVNVPGTFLGLVSLFYAAKLLKEDKKIYYILGGVSLGLAFGMEYSQIFFVVPFLVGHIFGIKKKKTFLNRFYLNKNLVMFFLFFVLSLFIVSSFFFIKIENFFFSKTFFEQRASEATSLLSGNNISTPVWYILYFMMSGVYYPIFFTTALGILILIYRRNEVSFLLLSYLIVFSIFLFLNKYRVDRLAVPLMPLFAVCSGLAIVSLEKIFQKIKIQFLVKKLILVAGISLIFIIPLARSLLFSLIVSQKDTRQLGAEWVEENYPKDQAIFAVGDTIHIGHYLQKNGFDNVINAYPLESQDIFLYSGEVLLIDSTNYHIAKNYSKVESYKKFWENYQLIKAKGKLIKGFSQPLFKAEFFSPAFLEHSSTVNAYHNPTVEIYKIPKLPGLWEKKVSFEYLPEKMKKSGTNMPLVDIQGRKMLYAEGNQVVGTVGPYKMFPKGNYLLEYFVRDVRCHLPGVIFTLQVTSAGGGREFASRKVSCSQLKKYNSLTLDFQLKNASLLELKMVASKGASFFIEKALLTKGVF